MSYPSTEAKRCYTESPLAEVFTAEGRNRQDTASPVRIQEAACRRDGASPKDENGEPNAKAKHQGCPVEKGTKYIITKWFRERPWGVYFDPLNPGRANWG